MFTFCKAVLYLRDFYVLKHFRPCFWNTGTKNLGTGKTQMKNVRTTGIENRGNGETLVHEYISHELENKKYITTEFRMR
jgi:hypothetical protein